MTWLKQLFDAGDPSASLRHTAYAAVVGSGIGWLTVDIARGPMTTTWVAAFGILVGAVTTAKIQEKPAEAAK